MANKCLDKIADVWLNLESRYQESNGVFNSRNEFLLGVCGYNNGRTSLSKLRELLENEKVKYNTEELVCYENIIKMFDYIDKNLDKLISNNGLEDLDRLYDLATTSLDLINILDDEKINRFLRHGNLNSLKSSFMSLAEASEKYDTFIPKTVMVGGKPKSINIEEEGYWYANSPSFFNGYAEQLKTDEQILKMGIFVSKKARNKRSLFPILFLDKNKFALVENDDKVKLPAFGKNRASKYEKFDSYLYKRMKFNHTNITVVLI